MAEFKGTKGKWYLQEYSDAYTNIIRCNSGIGFETKWIGSTSQSSGNEERYNAKLMAAAPELLEALEEIIEMNRQTALDQYGDAEKAESWSCVTIARKAIKKATE